MPPPPPLTFRALQGLTLTRERDHEEWRGPHGAPWILRSSDEIEFPASVSPADVEASLPHGCRIVEVHDHLGYFSARVETGRFRSESYPVYAMGRGMVGTSRREGRAVTLRELLDEQLVEPGPDINDPIAAVRAAVRRAHEDVVAATSMVPGEWHTTADVVHRAHEAFVARVTFPEPPTHPTRFDRLEALGDE